jgi:type I restriction enzyme, S subunit
MVLKINLSTFLPSGWEWVKLNEVCKTSSGGTPSRKNEKYFNGNIPWLKSGELSYNIIKDSEEKITKEAIENSSAKIFPKGTLLIALYGATVGRLGILGVDAATNQAVSAIFTHKFLLRKHLYWFLFSYRDKLLKDRIGGAQPNISQTILNDISLPFPPLNEQHQIVAKIEELFSELDNGIENLIKARKQLITYRQAVLKYAFEGRLTKEWRTQQKRTGNPPEPAEKLLEQIKTEREKHYQKQIVKWKQAVAEWKENGEKGKKPTRISMPKTLSKLTSEETEIYGELPTSWRWSTFCNVTYKIGDIDHKMPKDFTGGLPYLSTGNLKKDGTIDFANAKTISKEDFKRLSLKIKPERGDIIFPRYGTIGRNILINFNKEFLVSYSCAIIKNIHSLMDSKFIYYYSLSPVIKKEIEKYTVQTTQANIGIASIENFIFPLCSLPEQQAIVSEIESRLSVCDKLEQTIEDSFKKAEALRQSILKKAFAGELTKNWREKHPELITGENSAEKLLEKIKAEKALSIAIRKKPQLKKMKSKKIKIEPAK